MPSLSLFQVCSWKPPSILPPPTNYRWGSHCPTLEELWHNWNLAQLWAGSTVADGQGQNLGHQTVSYAILVDSSTTTLWWAFSAFTACFRVITLDFIHDPPPTRFYTPGDRSDVLDSLVPLSPALISSNIVVPTFMYPTFWLSQKGVLTFN